MIFLCAFADYSRTAGPTLINLSLFKRAPAVVPWYLKSVLDSTEPVLAEYCISYLHSWLENSVIDWNYFVTGITFVSLAFVILKLRCKTVHVLYCTSSSIHRNIHIGLQNNTSGYLSMTL